MAKICIYLFNQSMHPDNLQENYCRSNEHNNTQTTVIHTHNSSILTPQLDSDIICSTVALTQLILKANT